MCKQTKFTSRKLVDKFSTIFERQENKDHCAFGDGFSFFLLSSVSSDYQDLMPQFLRAVRILCTLHKYYLDAVGAEPSSSPIINSVPSSPLSTSIPNSNLQELTSDVRRVGSYGSLLDNPRNRGGSGRSKLRSFRGHRRSRSQTNPPQSGTNSGSNTSPSSPPSQSHSDTISNPFEELEMVWGSLESWFDLLMVEVQKLEEQNETLVTGPGKQTPEPKSNLGTEPASKPEISPHSPTNSSHTPDISPSSSPRRKPSKLQLPSLHSSQLAAAIVKSAPQERRAIYLKSSSSFDVAEPTLPLPHLNDAALKRRSWHVERVVARMLTLGCGGSLTSLPTFSRSLSSDPERPSGECTSLVPRPHGSLGMRL